MITISQSIQAYIDAMVEEIRQAAPKKTGALRNSIKSNINITDDGFEVSIDMLDYGYYLDQGVNGTGPKTPKSKHSVVTGSPYSFKGMIASSPFSKYTSSLSEQFAIATSVSRNGIVARNFIQPNLDKKLEGLANLTADEIFNELSTQFNKK
jgi:hypothetical protein